MTFEFIVLGDLYEDLYYESNFLEDNIKLLTSKILNFIKYNPDDLSRTILEKILLKVYNDNLIQNDCPCYFKRGGNGSSLSEIFTRSGIPTKLLSVIRREGEWMVDELVNIGVDTTNIICSDEILPIRVLVTSSSGTRILFKPNSANILILKEKLLEDFEFQRSKLIFCASISDFYVNLLEKGSKLGLLTAFSTETKKIKFNDPLVKFFSSKHDILFLKIKDASDVVEENQLVKQIDNKYRNYAKIRVYTSGKKGTIIKSDNLNLKFPSLIKKNKINSLSSEECFQGGFLIKFFELINNKEKLNELLNSNNAEPLKSILVKCEEFAELLANFEKSYKHIPNRKDLESFISNIKK